MAEKKEHRDAQFLDDIEKLKAEVEAETGGAEASPAKSAPQPDAPTAPNADDEESEKTAKNEAEDPKPQKRSTLQMVRDFTADEDGEPIVGTHKMTLSAILGGELLAGGWFRRQFWYIIMVMAMLIAYVSNRYYYQQEMIEQRKLSDTLLDRRYKALTISSQLKERTRRSQIEESLADTTLQTPNTPSFNLKVEN